jgi:predicted transcriptional regulator
MRRIQVMIDAELDDRLEREALARGRSKSALVREGVARVLDAEPLDNGLEAIGALTVLFEDVESEDIDTVLYGSLEAET